VCVLRMPIAASSPRARSARPNPCDFLIAFDCVIAEPTLQDYPSAALPLTGTGSAPEQASVTGFSCQNNWTIEMAGELPDHCWDLTDVNRPKNKVLCTLYRSSTKWITITHEVNQLVLRFSNGDSLALQASHFQSFAPLRGSPVLFAVSCTETGNNATYRLSASIGGSEVFSTTKASVPNMQPTEIRFGNQNGTNIESMLWYAGRIHETQARTEAQIAEALQTLDMLVLRSFVIPPGGGAL
jgi:hypothetical protein